VSAEGLGFYVAGLGGDGMAADTSCLRGRAEQGISAAQLEEVVPCASVIATAMVVPLGPPRRRDDDTAAARVASVDRAKEVVARGRAVNWSA